MRNYKLLYKKKKSQDIHNQNICDGSITLENFKQMTIIKNICSNDFVCLLSFDKYVLHPKKTNYIHKHNKIKQNV